ncbi:protoporphyrinogen/coproporphyrinogen oxidase [Candidatus Nitrosotenuis uzonensis]|uniref:Protoporphyrinogen oxidase n=1 Tax=Candidatus Nitrosotenuis uzonensis TaxID=1407055 RepID=A0A812F0X5_9ARCH|nr:FAD-dependent oxidoreductase [Candidatus Nitrosotenuis uzonensis]CAE6492346.1 Protoporphyrinogen oxidase [Candidatus Nitrosotenuis uzonensis]
MKKRVAIIGAGISGLCTGALLAKEGIEVTIFEKSARVGGRTISTQFRGHILDNGFHIMPFYKTSSVYTILADIGILGRIPLAKVHDISFYQNGQFHRYPKGLGDILRMSLLPLKSKISLLRILIPMAFSSIKRSEKLDEQSLDGIISKLEPRAKSFFDAVCMLAFADTPDRVALGEFVRTIIRANPLRGGTSEFAYPSEGGYDTICKVLASYILEQGGKIHFNRKITKVRIKDGVVRGIVEAGGGITEVDCVVISYPAYLAVHDLFEEQILDAKFLNWLDRLHKTTSVVEVHFCLAEKIDTRQIVFPINSGCTAKGIFFVSNISPSVSPPGQQLIMAGTPVSQEYADDANKIREITKKMKMELANMYPAFERSLLWERPMSWKLVEAVVKEPGMVWKKKAPHQISGINGLFFVGDSTVSYGIGTDSAAHSSLLCHPKILSYLKG